MDTANENQVPDILGGADGKQNPPEFTALELSQFVTAYIDTGDALSAAIRAGLQNERESILLTADRVIQMPAVQSAIQAVVDLKKAHARIVVTRESLVEDMQHIKEKALQDRQYNSAISAGKLQAMLMGILEQKIRVTHTTDPEKMSDEDLERIASGGKVIDVSEFEDVTGKDS